MASAQVGDRVGAVMSANKSVVKVFGYGVRVEDKVPPSDAGGFGEVLHSMGKANPCILLDSGKEVFGCECWWGPESVIEKRFAGLEVVEVDIEEVRRGLA